MVDESLSKRRFANDKSLDSMDHSVVTVKYTIVFPMPSIVHLTQSTMTYFDNEFCSIVEMTVLWKFH